ncbi:transposase domain-containing protein [Streptomyces sp. NPDC060028]|uniref:transposase domain-containing protein n=1 Tax=Streptomyces sp. NPDC060028 TaxID=3347041 RepID=UPI003684CC25
MARAGQVASDGSGRLAYGIAAGILTWAFPPSLVDEAVAAAGRTEQRSRSLSARTMVYHALAMWMYPSSGYEEVMRRLMLGLSRKHHWADDWRMPSPSALTQARQRLGPAPLRLLFRAVAPTVAGLALPGALEPIALDTLTLGLPDTTANREHFGACPRVRVTALGHCGTQAVLDAALTAPSAGEGGPARDLLRSLGKGALLLAELDTLSVELWRRAAAAGADLLWRAGPDWKLPVDRVLPDGSYLSRLAEPGPGAGAEPPVPVRVITYADCGGAVDRLITSVLAPADAAATRLIHAHHTRWRLTDTLGDLAPGGPSPIDVLRSRSPELVEQEIWAMLLMHHAVRGLLVDPRDLDGRAAAELAALVRTVRMIAPDCL